MKESKTMKKFQKSLNSLAEFLVSSKCEKCGKQAVHIMPFTSPPHFFCDEHVPFKAKEKQTEKEKSLPKKQAGTDNAS